MSEPQIFHHGEFGLHSGEVSNFKIDCDALTEGDLETVAKLLVQVLPPFGDVQGIPTGGLRLANHLLCYASWDETAPLLIVDDVLTTGASMKGWKLGVEGGHSVGWPEPIGAVIFARGPCPTWVTPLFYTAQPF